jgi:hypothetical protein
LIGPEVESEVAEGFSLRRFALNHGEKLMNAESEALSLLVADELAATSWHVVRDEECSAVANEIARAELAAAPWWLWWNILSLDAPMVAVAWALVFAKCAGVNVPGTEIAVLGLVVWLIYTVDRLLDGRDARNDAGAFGSPLRQRHFFHRLEAQPIACIAASVAVFTAVVVFTQIGEQILRPAVPLGLVLVLYMAWVHLGRGRVLTQLSKEVAVGGVFAAGVALPTWSRLSGHRWEFCVLAALFAAVCTLNCVVIEEWEWAREMECGIGNGVRRSMAATDFAPGKFAAVLAACVMLLAPVVRLGGEFSAIGAAIAGSALLILLLDLMRERISADGLRVLADVALLLPALAVLAAHG